MRDKPIVFNYAEHVELKERISRMADVVRCRQCAFYEEPEGDDLVGYCRSLDGIGGYVAGDDYCSHGARKDRS